MSYERVPRDLKAAVSSAAEAAWRLGFWVVGRVRAPTAARWWSPGGLDVAVVAAHSDDEVVGCAGTVVRHREAGDHVRVVVVTDGSGSRALGLGPAEMARRRRAEAEEAANVLGVELDWIGAREGHWQVEALAPELASKLEGFRPDIVYAPSYVDFHPEHRLTAHALALALGRLKDGGARPRVRCCQLQVPLVGLVNLVTDTSTVSEVAARACGAYVTQQASLARIWRMRRYAACRHTAGREAEAFWEMSAADYVRAHRLAPRPLQDNRFRGLRHHALLDPLSYARGSIARRQLSAAARS